MEHGGYNEGHSYYSSILNSQNWAYIYLDNKNEIKHYINELIYGEKKNVKLHIQSFWQETNLFRISTLKIKTPKLTNTSRGK